MVKVNRLRGKIVEHGKSVSAVAHEIGMSPSTLYRKLKNRGGETLTLGEVVRLADVLQLTHAEVNDIFFTHAFRSDGNSDARGATA